jgi:predicted enzyme related to lactoylglutathione lyase
MRLGLTLIYVEDFPTMLAFYRDVLGLQMTSAKPGAGYAVGVDWAQLSDGNGGVIELVDHARFGETLELPLPRANASVLTFEVDDLDATAARLRESGVELFGEGRYDWGGAAHFFDPEGNHFQVFQLVPRQALP